MQTSERVATFEEGNFSANLTHSTANRSVPRPSAATRFTLLRFDRAYIISRCNSETNNQWASKHHDQLSVRAKTTQKGGYRERAFAK